MRRKATLALMVLAMAIIMALPGTAYGMLVNEYGMYFAGQSTCVSCHIEKGKSPDIHSDFVKFGLQPAAPAGWTAFKDPWGLAPDTTNAGGFKPPAQPNTPYFWAGGSYPIAAPWITLGLVQGAQEGTEVLIWKGATELKYNPWNLVEGLRYMPHGEWLVGEEPARGLYDVSYNCYRCHMLGPVKPGTPGAVQPAATATAIGWTWSAPETGAGAFNAAGFMATPAVSMDGMGIQCERCHGTGIKSATDTTNHGKSATQPGAGTELSHRLNLAAGETGIARLGNSQVCGQCHGQYADRAGTAGIYGYTPNLPMRNFVNINSGVYTKTPTEAEFMASAAAAKSFSKFPNGSYAKGNHFIYNDWSTSAHAHRGAYYDAATRTSTDPDALVGAALGTYDTDTWDLSCGKCHAGEYYLKTKNDPVTATFTPTKANIGYLGVECVMCHDAHPDGLEAETNMRTPDAAGVRSNAGRATANQSVCEDCHNWRYEVLGTSPVVAPIADLGNDGGPSVPQRETLHGRSMLEIPEAAQFMPGVKCEECHLPRSLRSATRYSHSMAVLEPGEADKWMTLAGYNADDSCSPCHPAATRAELQADIDAWRADVTASSSAAASAISAAQTRSEFSMTVATNPGYILAGKATWNYKAAQNDKSGGIHNPPYVVAGLNKATQMAKSVGGSFKTLFASSSLNAGATGFVTGKVINGDGTGAAGAVVTLVGGGGGTATADANGNFAFMVAPSATTTYQVKWERSSDARTHLLSSPVTITVAGVAPAPGPTPPTGSTIPVYRFFNPATGVHFYTASADEANRVITTMAATWQFEGVVYTLNTASPAMKVPLYRFYSPTRGVHFYTADEAEKNNVIATMSNVWQFEGVAYYVASGTGAPVYRFYNVSTGTHFYTASESEKASVVANYGAIYRLEGPAFYLAP